MPHRAFSLFLFNTKNELLLQQRSDEKITFPSLWTNTCCSHPRHTEDEIDTSNGFVGPRRASVRRTAFEMGITDLQLDMTHCGDRILYYADADENFAEYELDYIVFAQYDIGSFSVNKTEVKNH
jgi:isopentenyl-diphosphate Delta-isomerase